MPIFRLYRLLQVSVSGFYAWRNRGPSQRQLDDMVLLAHVRAAFRRSRESYGAERVHHELAENGIEVGRHRVARLMRGNGLSPKRKQKFKRRRTASTTRPSHRTFSTRTSPPRQPTRNGLPTSAISGRYRAGCTWPSCSTSTPGASSAGPVGARMTSDLPLRALNRAIGLRQPGAGVIHHSDSWKPGRVQPVVATHLV